MELSGVDMRWIFIVNSSTKICVSKFTSDKKKNNEMNKDEFIAYYHLENKTDSVQRMSIGAINEEYEGEKLVDLFESEITKELIQKNEFLKSFLPQIGIKYPNCWIGVELSKNLIYPDWKATKPGDVDLVIGNLKDDKFTFCFENVVGIQIKIRKVTDENELRSFPTGRGTKQSHLTAEMGFDKTVLLHILIKEPEKPPAGFSVTWNTLSNANFFHHAHRCIGAVRKRVENDIFGYGWIGWGQGFGDTWKRSGILKIGMIKSPPEKPYLERSELNENRKILLQNLREAFKKIDKSNKNRPLIFYDEELRV